MYNPYLGAHLFALVADGAYPAMSWRGMGMKQESLWNPQIVFMVPKNGLYLEKEKLKAQSCSALLQPYVCAKRSCFTLSQTISLSSRVNLEVQRPGQTHPSDAKKKRKKQRKNIHNSISIPFFWLGIHLVSPLRATTCGLKIFKNIKSTIFSHACPFSQQSWLCFPLCVPFSFPLPP